MLIDLKGDRSLTFNNLDKYRFSLKKLLRKKRKKQIGLRSFQVVRFAF